MKKLLVFLILIFTVSMAKASTSYEIEKIVNDETLIINGEVFKAQTYCMGWNEGEQVIFLEGSAWGTCVSAKLYNKDTSDTCDVWCE